MKVNWPKTKIGFIACDKCHSRPLWGCFSAPLATLTWLLGSLPLLFFAKNQV